MNTIQDRVMFGAKLDYYNIKGNKKRWSKIAEIFENKTKKYPHDFFSIETNDKSGIYFHPQYQKKELLSLNSYDKGEISSKTTSILNKYSDEVIADTMKKLFLIRRKADAMLADYFKLEKKHGLCDKIYTEDDTVLGKFLERALIVRKDMTKILLRRDQFLKHLKGISVV